MTAPIVATRDLGEPAEREVVRALVRRGLIILPVAILIGFLGWGVDGAASVALGIGLVLANFAIAAALMGWAARISLGLLMGVALFGFLIRLSVIWAVVWLLRDQPWLEPLPLGLALVVGHLGLLIWETRHVSASLAFPGLKPEPAKELR